MADVLFRYLLMARERDQSWYRRAFLADERLLAAGIERLVETAAVRIDLSAQYERFVKVTSTSPASHAAYMTFYEHAEPNRPMEPDLFEGTEKFPLRSTLVVAKCRGCHATGRIPCPACHATGQEGCPACEWHGTSTLDNAWQGPCDSCGGTRKIVCRSCRGALEIAHTICGGEGQVATWQEEVFTYSVRRERELQLPPGSPGSSMADAVEKWLETHNELVLELNEETAAAHLGYETPELWAVLPAVRRVCDRIKQRMGFEDDRCLFVVMAYHVVPAAACVVRSERTADASHYWLIGRGEEAIELRPRPVPDRWKVAGWPALLLGTSTGASAIAGAHGLSLFAVAASGTVEVAISGMAIAGLAVAGVGLKRVLFGQPDPVHTVAILPCADRPTAYLTCLAVLGSFCQRLEVVDRSYRSDLESLMGNERPNRQSRSVVIRVRGGRMTRLIELGNPAGLTRGELARMAEVVDGLVFLQEPGFSETALRSRIHGATIARPPEGRLLLERDALIADETGAAPNGGAALEMIRRAFVKEIDAKLDWNAVFERLWAPIEKVLERPRRAMAGRPTESILESAPGTR